MESVAGTARSSRRSTPIRRVCGNDGLRAPRLAVARRANQWANLDMRVSECSEFNRCPTVPRTERVGWAQSGSRDIRSRNPAETYFTTRVDASFYPKGCYCSEPIRIFLLDSAMG